MKELTRAQYLRANERRPRFQTFVVDKDGVALRERLPPMTWWFEYNDVGQEHGAGRYLRIPSLATVALVVDGKTSVLFYLNERHVESCTFAYDLYPLHLERAVRAMRRARLGRFVRPAAEWAVQNLPKERKPILQKALRTLLRSLPPRKRSRKKLE